MTLKELETMLSCPVKAVYNAAQLKAILTTGQVI
jgi:hypothetical protein